MLFWQLASIRISSRLPRNCLLSLKRLNENRKLLKNHDYIFQEQLKPGLIEEVHYDEKCGNVTYLLHREVENHQKKCKK